MKSTGSWKSTRLTGEILGEKEQITIYPGTHFVTREEKLKRQSRSIEEELERAARDFARQEKFWKPKGWNSGPALT